MARFNFPSRLPRGSVVGIDAFPSNLVTDRRNFYTELQFVSYSAPFSGTGNIIGDVLGVAGQFIGDVGINLGESLQTGLTLGQAENRSRSIDGSIMRLPIPRKLNDNHVLSWNEQSFTDMITNFAIGTAEATGAISYRSGAAARQLYRAATGPASAFTGATLNPYLFLYFDRPAFRRFSFTWTLAARNSSESDKIRKIVNNLKKGSSPDVNALTMGYPDLLRIKIMPNDVFGMLIIKDCVVESVSVDHTPAGPSFFEGSGAPTLVNLTLNLKETKLWSNQDYNDIQPTPTQEIPIDNRVFDAAGNIVDSTGVATESGTPEITLAP